jgi:hypothetical protein
MNYRTVTLHAQESFSADTTKVIDINLADPISQLVIGLDVTNGSATMTAHPVACLTKIELVDGSEVIYSLDGYEAEALDWYNNGGKFRSNWNAALNGNSMTRIIGIHFGRYLFDPVFALDPGRFNNLQLKISLDIDAGGGSASANKVTVWANVFDERIPDLQGYLMSKEIKEYTIASSTHEYTDLPTDYPYRGIYFRPFVAGTEPNQTVSNFKISEDQDKRIPIDHGVQDIERLLLQKYGPVEEHYYFAGGTSTKYLYVAPTTRVVATANRWAATAADAQIAVYNGDGGKLNIICDTAGTNMNVFVRGFVPHCVYQLPTGMQDDPNDWWDVRGINSLRADITGASTATGYLFIQQLRTY